jgi:hypothetical protein
MLAVGRSGSRQRSSGAETGCAADDVVADVDPALDDPGAG